MTNLGVSPVDTSTAVGLFRADLGDVNSVPLEPVIAGFADYAWFSDLELEAYLVRGAGSMSRAHGYLAMALAQNAALSTEKSIRTDDLAIDKKGGSKSLLEIAKEWFDRADAEDAAELSNAFYFDIVQPERPRHYRFC